MAAVTRCPCCSLCIVYLVALLLSIILVMMLGAAMREDEANGGPGGLGAIVTSGANYDLSDIRSIKKDSLEVRRRSGLPACFARVFCAPW